MPAISLSLRKSSVYGKNDSRANHGNTLDVLDIARSNPGLGIEFNAFNIAEISVFEFNMIKQRQFIETVCQKFLDESVLYE